MADEYQINAKITADSTQFESAINKVKQSTSKFGKQFENSTKGIIGNSASLITKIGGIGLAVGAVSKVFKTVGKAIAELDRAYSEHEKVVNVLNSTLQATGATAWTTSQQLQKSASELQRMSNFADESIMGMQTVLLGFKSIKGDTFDKATMAIADMATVMKMDLSSAAQTVGKALDDPINGLSSLSRQGFVFSEEQKKLIKSFMDAGDVAKAQGVILEELNTTYGGAAKASADAGTRLKNSWSDLKETLGKPLAKGIFDPVKNALSGLIENTVDGLKEVEGALDSIDRAKRKSKGEATADDVLIEYDTEVANLKRLIEYYNLILTNLDNYSAEEIAHAKRAIQNSTIELHKWEERKLAAEKAKKAEADAAEAAERQRKQDEENARIAAERADWIKKNQEALDKEIASITLRAQAQGKEVDQQEIYNAKLNSYVSLVAESNGLVKESSQIAKNRLADLERTAELLPQIASESKEAQEWLIKAIESQVNAIEREKQTQIELLEERKAGPKEIFDIESEYSNKQIDLMNQVYQIKRDNDLKEAESRKATAEEIANINAYWDEQSAQITEKYSAKRIKIIEQETKKEKKRFEDLFKQIKSVMNKITGVFSKVFSGLNKLFNLDFDDLIISLLELEDKILTFFTSTLPKLPQLVSSILDSIVHLIVSIASNPEFIKSIVQVIIEIGKILLDNFPILLEATLKILIQLVTELIANLPKIVHMIIKSLPSIIEILVTAIWDMIVGAFKAIGGWFSSAWNWIGDKLGWWATGVNNAPSGLAVVGEQGPELIDFKGGERVYNASDTRQILSGAGSASSGNNFNVTFNNVQDTTAFTMIQQLKDFDRQLAINGVL